MTTSPHDNRLYAYEVVQRHDMPLTVGLVGRAWMDATNQRFAYRCLPMTIANQAGWMIHSPCSFAAIWDGGIQPESLRIEPVAPVAGGVDTELPLRVDEMFGASFVAGGAPLAQQPDHRVNNYFGHGIVTFAIPYLFRTPRGVNLWVKGPSNSFKDGAHPLEGVVETDWSPATFTMNWKLTRPNYPVRFERGEPICMVVPMVRGLAEAMEPCCMPLEANPELLKEYQAWSSARFGFLAALAANRPDAVERGWQRDYMQGMTSTGEVAPEHQTRLELKEFKRS